MPHEVPLAIFGTLLAMGGLVWKLATLTTRFEEGLRKLTADVNRIEPRLTQLDDIAVIKRDVTAIKDVQLAQSNELARHRSDIEDLTSRAARADGAEAMRRSQGGFQ